MKGQTTRLLKEFRMLQSELPPGILCTPKHESLDQYEARIDGPPDTPYERGRFLIDVALSAQYPMEPPSMRFKTRIYHPNIDNHGNICLDVLKTGKNGCWNPSWTLGRVLVSLTVLLGSPNPHDPLMPDIADQMLNDHAAYLNAAREWTTKHAMGLDDDPSEQKSGSSQEAVAKDSANESPTAKRRRDAEDNGQKQQQAIARTGSASKRGTRMSRKSSASTSASPSPEGKASLPPAHAKLPGPTGIRRLGLSRSSKKSPSANIPPPQPLLASSSPEPRHSQPAPPEPRQQESSQAESIEIGSSNDSQDRSEASPRARTKPDARIARRTKDARLSQILSPLRKKSRRSRRQAISASQTSASSQSPEEEPKITGAETPLEEPPDQTTLSSPANGELSEIASTHDDSVDYDCLLGTDDTTNNGSNDNSAYLDDNCALATVAETPSPSPPAQQLPVATPAEASTSKPLQKEPDHLASSEAVVEVTHVPDKPAISPAAGEKAETRDRQKSEERGKGKAVDYSIKPPGTHSGGGDETGEEVVLHESHFGPLDLGLPPVRVSAQRKLMRRRRAG
ncbi:Ubiquitin-conjugating enzyme E2 T [Coemansia guatemalensis]|uniref:Ubiquitin-conjugating enzyme E2 T n=1 Tax=Coemansia guatemalensis TaxID=2761395 RepID=A0A9W8HTK3_9FUNG|nr:Ubiquitin-conjugating enzyme E2 T [Coemansia guatemalensis]